MDSIGRAASCPSSPFEIRRKLRPIAKATTRLLKQLGVTEPSHAADGPDDEEVRNWLADATPGVRTRSARLWKRLVLSLRRLKAIEAADKLKRAALKASDDPFYGLIMPSGNTGDDIVNEWIATMLPLFTEITGKPARTSVGRTGRPNEGVAR